MTTSALDTSTHTKPLLRGVSHEVALTFALGGAIALMSAAPTSRALVAAAVYGLSLAALFGVSALYHRPMWPPGPRAVLKRIDHSTIFIFIAGTYTPFCLLLGGHRGVALLAVVWGGATLGVLRAVFWPGAPRALVAALYVLLGWLIVPVMPELWRAVGPSGIALLGAGGIVYTLGAVVYATRRPNPSPRVFGYHEVFHLMVIAASVCHFVVVAGAIKALH